MAKQGTGQWLDAFKESRLRQGFRKGLFRFLRKMSETDEAREIWSSTLKGQLAWQPRLSIENGVLMSSPYEDLGMSDYATQTAQRNDVIFITGRFRSGSTLLWNLFCNIPGVTAYYEPFNERR